MAWGKDVDFSTMGTFGMKRSVVVLTSLVSLAIELSISAAFVMCMLRLLFSDKYIFISFHLARSNVAMVFTIISAHTFTIISTGF